MRKLVHVYIPYQFHFENNPLNCYPNKLPKLFMHCWFGGVANGPNPMNDSNSLKLFKVVYVKFNIRPDLPGIFWSVHYCYSHYSHYWHISNDPIWPCMCMSMSIAVCSLLIDCKRCLFHRNVHNQLCTWMQALAVSHL